jgi:hypothetical protein
MVRFVAFSGITSMAFEAQEFAEGAPGADA